MRWPLMWRRTHEAAVREFTVAREEAAALNARLAEKLDHTRLLLAEAEARAVVPRTVKEKSDADIRDRLAKRGLQGAALDQAAQEIMQRGLATIGRLK